MDEQYAELVTIAERVRRLAQDMQGPGAQNMQGPGPSELQKLLNDIGESQRQLVGLNASDSEYTRLVNKTARLREIYEWGRNRGDGSPSVRTIRNLSLLMPICDTISNSSGVNRENLFQDAYNMILKFSKKDRLPRMSKYNRDLLLRTMDRARRLILRTPRESRYDQCITEVKLWIEGLTVAKELPGVVTFWTRLSDGTPWKTDAEYIEFINKKVQQYKSEHGAPELDPAVLGQQGMFNLETVCEWYSSAPNRRCSLEDVLASFFAVDFLAAIGVGGTAVDDLREVLINFIANLKMLKPNVGRVNEDIASVVNHIQQISPDTLLEYGIPTPNKQQMIASIEKIRSVVASWAVDVIEVNPEGYNGFLMFWTNHNDGMPRMMDSAYIDIMRGRLLKYQLDNGVFELTYENTDQRVYYIYSKIIEWWEQHLNRGFWLVNIIASFFAVEFARMVAGSSSAEVDEVERILVGYVAGERVAVESLVQTNVKLSDFRCTVDAYSRDQFSRFQVPFGNRSRMATGILSMMGFISQRSERHE